MLDDLGQEMPTLRWMLHTTPGKVALAATVALALVASGCGDDDQSTGSSPTAGGEPSADSVTIYSGRNEELVQPIFDQFTEATGIEVRAKYADSADLALLIEEEAAAGRTEADVYLSQSPGSIEFLDQEGRLAQLPDNVLALVPEEVRDDDGRWVGFSGRQRVLVYNTELVDEADLPTTVFDLTGEEWEGDVGVAPANGSFQDFVTAMRATEGDETTSQWLTDLAENDAVSYPKNSAIVAAVGRGEVPIGIVNHYYNYRALDEDPGQSSANHQFAPGDPGSILIVTGAAVVEGTDRPQVAAELIAFLLGDTGQQYFANETFEYPLAIGQAPAPVIPPIDFADVGSIDYDALGGGLASTRQMIADAGLEG